MNPDLQGRLDAANAARKGNASPRRPKVTGGRARLAEPIYEGAPWWLQRAYYLRTDKNHRWSYQRIADDLGVPYRHVYKWLNRERVHATNVAYRERNREDLRKRHREAAQEHRVGPPCTVCGEALHAPLQGKRAPLCAKCRSERARVLEEACVELYVAGWPLRDIDKHLNEKRGTAATVTSRVRMRGVDIPQRRAKIVDVSSTKESSNEPIQPAA